MTLSSWQPTDRFEPGQSQAIQRPRMEDIEFLARKFGNCLRYLGVSWRCFMVSG
jgi:hypothetical protein